MKPYFSIPQAAKLCSVDRSTMHRWVASGKIKSYSTPGGHKRILPRDLAKWLKDNDMPFEVSELPSDRKRILIVDDEASVRNYLKQVLSGIFVDIETACDGFAAGKKLMQFMPDLVILDLFMPDMDGFEVCRTMKQDSQTKHIKVLILTGHASEENQTRALQAGADAVLKKPSSKNEILVHVETLLQ